MGDVADPCIAQGPPTSELNVLIRIEGLLKSVLGESIGRFDAWNARVMSLIPVSVPQRNYEWSGEGACSQPGYHDINHTHDVEKGSAPAAIFGLASGADMSLAFESNRIRCL